MASTPSSTHGVIDLTAEFEKIKRENREKQATNTASAFPKSNASIPTSTPHLPPSEFDSEFDDLIIEDINMDEVTLILFVY